MSDSISREELLKNANEFFLDLFKNKAISYSRKKYTSFNINPFTIQANALAISTEISFESIAKAIVLPYALGTSMATSFGTNVQKFIVTTMGNKNAKPSTTEGMDIQYIDCLDGREKYCQLKAGPQTINKDDIKTIEDHFKGLRNLARTNHLPITADDYVVGVLYGDHDDLSSMYKTIESDGYNVFAGEEFWYRLTGLEGLYNDLIEQAQDAAKISGLSDSINELIQKVEKGVQENKDFFGFE